MQGGASAHANSTDGSILTWLETGGDCVLLAAGTQVRALAAVRVMDRSAGPVIVVTKWPEHYRDAFVAGGRPEARLAILPGAAEASELALRLAEYEAGLYRVALVTPDLLWDTTTAAALAVRKPCMFVVDLASLSPGLTDSCLQAREILLRLSSSQVDVPRLTMSDPLGAVRVRMLKTEAAQTVVHVGGVVPPQTHVRFVRLRLERERLEHLRRLVRQPARAVLVVAPSRRLAEKIGDSLLSVGIDCTLYHSGLGHAERQAVTAAYGDGRLRLIVATEAVGSECGIARTERIVFTHPPTSAEVLTRFAGYADGNASRIEVDLLFMSDELREIPERGRARAPTLAHVREAYRQLAAASHRTAQRDGMPPVGYALMPGDGLVAGKIRPTGTRLEQFIGAMHILEAAGYCTRLDNLPRAATITVLHGEGDFVDRLRQLLAASLGQAMPVEPVRLALQLGVSPDRLQRDLVEAQRADTVTYRGHGRDRLYELPRSPESAAGQVSRLVHFLSDRATREALGVADLVHAGGCRVKALEQALGWPPSPRCGCCDRCARDESRAPSQAEADIVLAVKAVARVPFSLRPGAVQRLVAAALKEGGRSAERASVQALVDEMVGRRWLAAAPGRFGSVYGLGDEGKQALAAWEAE